MTSTTSSLGSYATTITQAPSVAVHQAGKKKKRTCEAVTPFPFYAVPCDDRARYASACECLGVTATTKTATTRSVTEYVTVVYTTQDESAAGLQSTASMGPEIGLSSDPATTTGTASSNGDGGQITISDTLTGIASQTTGRATASSTIDDVPVLLTVVPSIPGSPQQKRATEDDFQGGFIGAPSTEGSCSVGTPFNLTDGQLSSREQVVGMNPGGSYIELVPSSSGIVSTTFSVVESTLYWKNESFFQGEAGFCQTTDGRVYATFTSSENWPDDCLSISIIVYKGKYHSIQVE